MFRLATALKGYREAGSLNDQINLFGFVDDHTFLTKSGDVGVVLAVKGVDYECLARRDRQLHQTAGVGIQDTRRQMPHLPVPLQRQQPSHSEQEP